MNDFNWRNHHIFVETRARATDCDTSKAAAKYSITGKAAAERKAIAETVKQSNIGMTAMEVANTTGIDYVSVQRRIAECGLIKTEQRRDGRAVWV
jgi:response regulator of citrate/malate metabolism